MTGEITIGIDLGTTNSVVAVMDDGDARIVANQEGNRTTPGIVALSPNGDVLVGEPARRQAITNPANTIHSVKRLLGRRCSDVAAMAATLSYTIVGQQTAPAGIRFGADAITPAEICSHLIRKLKHAAESELGHSAHHAVIAVPACFNNAQRTAIRDAGIRSGFRVVHIANDTTVTALAYAFDRRREARIAIVDLGGGTCDVSVIRVGKTAVEVLSHKGDPLLGGDDFTGALIEHLTDEFTAHHDADLRRDPMALQRLREAAEKAIKELSSSETTEINLPFIATDKCRRTHLQKTLTRPEFERLIASHVERLQEIVRQAVKSASLQPADIDEIVVVGGATRIPKIQDAITRFFARPVHRRVNPDEVVAIGAAIQAALIAGTIDEIEVREPAPFEDRTASTSDVSTYEEFHENNSPPIEETIDTGFSSVTS